MPKRPQNLTGWAVMNQDDQLIGLDSASGGYPYVPEMIGGVQVWPTLDLADHYCDVMNNPNDSYGHFSPVEVELRIK